MIIYNRWFENFRHILKAIYSLPENLSINISEDEYNYILNFNSDIHFDEKEFFKLLNEQQLRETLNT